MAGTMSFRLRVDHVYQRRFDTEALAEALKHSHWYLITRRPAVKIMPDSAHIQDQVLTVDFVVSDEIGTARTVSLGHDLAPAIACDFQVYADGSYFSVRLGKIFLHGDAWALASFMSHADAEIAKHEVMYAGKAFGDAGSSNAWLRTQGHKKLQSIYEDHVTDDWEIFVAPLSLERRMISSDDNIQDNEEGFSLAAFHETFAECGGNLLKPSIDIIEHALISYFVPPYNDTLTEWNISDPTMPMNQMRSVGLRLLHVHLAGWWGLARFYSQSSQRLVRSHSITREIPPRSGQHKNRRGWHGSGIESALVNEGPEFFESLAEKTGVMFRAFGETAPEVRKPGAVDLHQTRGRAVKFHHLGSRHVKIRKEILRERERTLKAQEPKARPRKSGYDPTTGSITVGYSETSKQALRLALRDTKTGRPLSTLIFGAAASGKSSSLERIGVETAMTGKFLIVPADPSGRHNFTDRAWNSIACQNFEMASNFTQTLANLWKVCHLIDFRRSKAIYQSPSKDVPSILLAVDDADSIFHDRLGVLAMKKILHEGSEAGVSVALVVSDILALESNPAVMRDLMSCDNILAFIENGNYVIDDLTARYRERRIHTWSSRGSTFVVHEGSENAILGIIQGVTDAELAPETVKSSCDEILKAIGAEVIGKWFELKDDSESWWTIDQNATRWFLRRHSDCWVLIQAISNSGPHYCRGARALEWASQVIDYRFEVKLEKWQAGPTTATGDVIALYADAVGEIAAKDTREATKLAMMRMF